MQRHSWVSPKVRQREPRQLVVSWKPPLRLRTPEKRRRPLSLPIERDRLSLRALPCLLWPLCRPDQIGRPCRSFSFCQALPCDGAAPVTWNIQWLGKFSDLECSVTWNVHPCLRVTSSERNFCIGLFGLDRMDLLGQAWQPTAQSTPKACNYTDRIRSFREVNEFTFDVFLVPHGRRRVPCAAWRKSLHYNGLRGFWRAMDTMLKSRMVFPPSQSNGKGLSPQIETVSAHHFSHRGEGRGVE